MKLLDALEERSCPVCGASADAATLFLESSVDPSRITEFSYSSRKAPEYMSFRLLRCGSCETVYAAQAPQPQALANAYHQADYDSSEEANLAADAYLTALKAPLAGLARHDKALEIGTGNGALLQRLRAFGFKEVVGVEPSPAAIATADPAIKANIIEGVFNERDFEPESLDLICCFQTLEHVPNPRELTQACHRLLRPGGLLAFVTHDYKAPINRILGARSPIIDIEHLQIFCRVSLSTLLRKEHFEVVATNSFTNIYPFSYWLRLTPLPAPLKGAASSISAALGLSRMRVALNVGNTLAVGRK